MLSAHPMEPVAVEFPPADSLHPSSQAHEPSSAAGTASTELLNVNTSAGLPSSVLSSPPRSPSREASADDTPLSASQSRSSSSSEHSSNRRTASQSNLLAVPGVDGQNLAQDDQVMYSAPFVLYSCLISICFGLHSHSLSLILFLLSLRLMSSLTLPYIAYPRCSFILNSHLLSSY